MEPPIVVLGAGVVGLTTALRLLEAGRPVTVWTRDDPADTVSAVAAAFWYPYLVRPEDAALRWGRASFARFAALAANSAAGVTFRPATILFPEAVAEPVWAGVVPGFRLAQPEELPPGYAGGYRFDAPVVEMPRHLPYLMDCITALGGTIIRRTVGRVEEAFAVARVVVNCTGLGARELVGDRELYAVRGQVVRTAKPSGEMILLAFSATGDVTYIVPRSGDAILGGTSETGCEQLAADPTTTADILHRCAAHGVGEVRPIETLVGLRPGRPSVRLEAERPTADQLLVHNYGHGGAGVTLAFGCADEVLRLVSAG